jgi:Pentapeptide repeats (8 copies)
VRSHAGPTEAVGVQVIECGPKLVANPEHLALIQQGVDVWNAWRAKEPSVDPDLNGADLYGALLGGANLSGARLNRANLTGANLVEANLSGARLFEANLSGADLSLANLTSADLIGANLSRADLSMANFGDADLSRADLSRADLSWANLSVTNLSRANLGGANLSGASLVSTILVDATLTGCRVYGTSAWDVKLSAETKQEGLIITLNEPEVTVDDLEVAQFVYLLLHNDKIRRVIDTVGKKGVLLLGRSPKGGSSS